MPEPPKQTLHRYLQIVRDAMLWKLEGLSEYDVRRPLTPTGTNLLGLVKHLASVEVGYFGDTFGRPSDRKLPWMAPDAELNADMAGCLFRKTEVDRSATLFNPSCCENLL